MKVWLLALLALVCSADAVRCFLRHRSWRRTLCTGIVAYVAWFLAAGFLVEPH